MNTPDILSVYSDTDHQWHDVPKSEICHIKIGHGRWYWPVSCHVKQSGKRPINVSRMHCHKLIWKLNEMAVLYGNLKDIVQVVDKRYPV